MLSFRLEPASAISASNGSCRNGDERDIQLGLRQNKGSTEDAYLAILQDRHLDQRRGNMITASQAG